MRKIKDRFCLPTERLIASWCAAAAVILCITDGVFFEKEFADSVSAVKAGALFAVCFVIFTAAAVFIPKLIKKTVNTDDYALALSVGVYAYLLVMVKFDTLFVAGVSAVAALTVGYLAYSDRLKLGKLTFGAPAALTVCGAAAIFCCAFIARETVCRYLTYSAPNFDFGIFVNMFHNMKESFSAVTTCERDGLLSHFAVHVSPVYYLLLPIYAIFPHPETLQICQAVIVVSAVIPLFLICRTRGLSYKLTAVVCAAFCFYPAVSGGCFYDIHENCFLLPLLMWCFYFFEKHLCIPAYVFALLVLTVKEDAFVYIVFFALFLIVAKRKYLHGMILAVSALLYFAGASYILKTYGEGIMSGRYRNFIVGDGGLVSVVKNVFADPALAVSEIFEKEKLEFIAQMLLPLAFVPFMAKKPENMLLILPMLLINVMTDYQYQYSIYFQYVFGSTAFLFYCSVLNLADMSAGTKRTLTVMMLSVSMLFFASTVWQKGAYSDKYERFGWEYKIMDEVTGDIPDDGSVCCCTFLLPHLAQRSVIYPLDSAHKDECEYVVIDLRYEKYEEAVIEQYVEKGYEQTDYREGIIAVFRNPAAEQVRGERTLPK